VSFLVTVLLIWGSMHAYAWARIKGYCDLPTSWASTLALALLVLMAAPIAGMALGRTRHLLAGGVVTLVGMLWAGAFFLFFWVSLLHDVWNGALTVAGFLVPAVRGARLLGAGPILAEAGLVCAITVYAVFEAGHITPEHVVVRTPKLPEGRDRLRIVQVCDIHLGVTVGERRLARILARVREARPDVLVSVGDLVDAEMGGMDHLAGMLADVQAPLGKWAVTGNHEYYAGIAQALEFTRRAGFTVLSEDVVRVCDGLSLAGVDDGGGLRPPFGRGQPGDEQAVLRRAEAGDYVVLLKHRPLVQKDSIPLFDMQLSGHTHRGQIFPFTLFVLGHYEYRHGLVELAPGRYLYTSRGSGTWGPPMRFLNPPEVTIIDIVREGTDRTRG
jgi:hypothetical protein